MSRKAILSVLAVLGVFTWNAGVQAQVVIETVTVGNPGNAAEWSGDCVTDGYGPCRECGAVDYVYDIGKSEVTAGQFTAFLNAVAASDTFGLYHTSMSGACGIERTGSSPNHAYSIAADWANRPVCLVSWGDAARFANWLHNGQPTGPQGLSTTEDGSYYLNGAMSDAELMAVTRGADATWVIPSEDQWYKAAYHYNDGVTGNYNDYPTSSDSMPSNDLVDPDPGNNANFYDNGFTFAPPYWRTIVGEFENSESPYSTFDQGGNVWEWNEAVINDSYRGVRGGSFDDYGSPLHASNRCYCEPTCYAMSWEFDIGFRVAKIITPMMLIPGGEFQMGDHHDSMSDALPVHAVHIDPFYMDRYEVTNQQYADSLNWAYAHGGLITVTDGVVYKSGTSYPYCDTTGSSLESRITWDEVPEQFGVVPGKEDHPMVMISWYGAAAYSNWLSTQLGRTPSYDLSTWQCNFEADGHRLPTEAEWEYATRGGNHDPYRKYPWGDTVDGSMANYSLSGDPYETGDLPWTTPVGYYDGNQVPSGVDMPNGYGLYDMAGNVWEWSNDWYSATYYSSNPYDNPKGPPTGSYRVFRGGTWYDDTADLRCADRLMVTPLNRDNSNGFRLALGVDTDQDGVPDASDNCPTVFNPLQADLDDDSLGAACDNCPTVPNPGQEDSDANGFGDACTGLVVAWGCGDPYDSGQCDVPPPNGNFVAVAGGHNHSIGLSAGGSVEAWGNNGYNQLDIPQPNENFVAIAAGDYFNLGLKADGYIVGWGENSFGQYNVPSPNSDFTAVAAGGYHSLGLKEDGSIVAWGCGAPNDEGQCTVPPYTDFVAVAAGHVHSLGLRADRSIAVWGDNSQGQLDNLPDPNSDFIAIAGGGFHSLGLKANGTIVAWGSNSLEQITVPMPNEDFVAVGAGYVHSVGLKADGSVVVWGQDSYGQQNVPDPNDSFFAISPRGVIHVMGIKPGCHSQTDCDDGQHCNGTEDCIDGSCIPGTPENCDDGIECTDDSCNEETDSCDNVADDANCDNGMWCDGDEWCDATLDCQPGAAPDCIDDVDCTVDSCNETTDSCDNAADDGYCEDGLFCNGAEWCDTVSDCQPGTEPCAGFIDCDEVNDVCVECLEDDDCSDNVYCNGAEICNAIGQCQPGTAVDCDDVVACTVDSCNEDADQCEHAPDHGACDDGNPCTDDSCDPVAGCVYVPNSATCDDELFCTETDQCTGGVCIGTGDSCPGQVCDEAGNECHDPCVIDDECDDEVSCTIDTCNTLLGICVYTPDNDYCDNGLFCDGAETCHPTLDCQQGNDPCVGFLDCDQEHGCIDCYDDPDCDDHADQCNDAWCNQVTRQCEYEQDPDGTGCDNGDPCFGDTCQGGICTDVCDDEVGCTIDSCDDQTGDCDNLPDDGACNDANECTDDACDPTHPYSQPVTGCTNLAVPDYDPCDDSTECTQTDYCLAGVCVGTDPVDCSDDKFCTRDTCDPADGSCDNTPDDDVCDDRAYCNGTETCDGDTGECLEGEPPCGEGQVCDEADDSCPQICEDDIDCDDGQFCNGVETCWATGTCKPGNDPCPGQDCDESEDRCIDCYDDQECDDGIACNGQETCDPETGICVSGIAQDCEDGLFCNGLERCDPVTGQCGDAPDPCDESICDEDEDRCVAPCTSDDPTDNDFDGVVDDCDNCVDAYNLDQSDADRDGIGDACDNCPYTQNGPAGGTCVEGRFSESCMDDRDCDTQGAMNGLCSLDQEQSDDDGVGDACDTDDDNDGWPDEGDNCPMLPNPGVECLELECCTAAQGQYWQVDTDCDGFGDPCDICPTVPNDDLDSDGDGYPDECDNCPYTPNPNQKNTDGDGYSPTDPRTGGDACDDDLDGDGIDQGDGGSPCCGGQTADCDDNCPTIPNSDQEDTDGDCVGDACDACHGFDDHLDDDGDGVPNDCDNCPNTWNPSQKDTDGDGYIPGDPTTGGDACDDDLDGDGILNDLDNCPSVFNPSQWDSDGDGLGDVCDRCPDIDQRIDYDCDGVLNELDNCLHDYNPKVVSDGPPPDCSPPAGGLWQQNSDCEDGGDACDDCLDPAGGDFDEDTVPDVCDNCPLDYNPGQEDFDGDLIGDVCDPDDDNDNWPDSGDNCRTVPNPDQTDSDGNGIGDCCDKSWEEWVDSNVNGVDDNCECLPSSLAEPEVLDLPYSPINQKLRYLSFTAGDAGRMQAVRVTFQSVPAPYAHWNDVQLWVQEPLEYCENAGSRLDAPCPTAVGGLPSTTFWGAALHCDPHFTDWTQYDMVHVWSEGLIPSGTYDVQVIDEDCWLAGEADYSDPLTLTQSVWADLISNCTTTPCGPPDGNTGIVDVTAVLDKFKNLPGNVSKARADLEGAPAGSYQRPDQVVNITDVMACLGAFLGEQYPQLPPGEEMANPPQCGP